MGKLRIAGWIIALGLLLSGCGGGSGGSGGGTTTPPPPSPPPPPPPSAVPTIDVTQVFPSLTFNDLVSLQQAPGDAMRWFAVEQPGVVRVFANNDAVSASSEFLDITDRVVSGGERGLLGVAFHPNFPATPDVYISYTGNALSGLTSYISRFSSGDGGLSLDPNSEQLIISIQQDATNHNGGHLVFGPDGYLYLGLGDGGGAGDPNDRAQDNQRLLGTMIRLDVDGGSPYAIPAGNPFEANPVCPQGVSGTQECPEIYAWGLRNPWRYSFDRQTGTLWLGDVGQNSWEEIDIITAGGDYGWDDREGAHCFEPSSGCITDSIDPITEYGRDLGASVTGGFVYRGSAVPDLVGWYVYGDFVSGRIFAIPADSQEGTETIELLDTNFGISTFAEDQDGEIYVIDYIGNGTIHRITDAP